MQPYPNAPAAPDPFDKVRRSSGALIVLLAIRASMRVVSYLLFRTIGGGMDLDTVVKIDGVLLGVENLVALVAMIMFLVWIYRVLKAIRLTGREAMSPGLGVGGWFIPFANVVLPWLSVRSALRAVQVTSPLAGIWWIVWLINMSLTGMHQFVRQMALVPELMDVVPIEMLDQMHQMIGSTFWPYFLTDTAAWALLAVIVVTVRNAVTPNT